jgi:hypothetical protein
VPWGTPSPPREQGNALSLAQIAMPLVDGRKPLAEQDKHSPPIRLIQRAM